jgi:hypothetical protein
MAGCERVLSAELTSTGLSSLKMFWACRIFLAAPSTGDLPNFRRSPDEQIGGASARGLGDRFNDSSDYQLSRVIWRSNRPEGTKG